MRNMKYEHSCRQGAGSYHYWCRLSSMRQPPYPFHHYHQHHCHCHHLNDEDDDKDHHLVLLYCSEEGFSARKVPNSLRQRFKGEQPQSLSSNIIITIIIIIIIIIISFRITFKRLERQ